MAVKKQIPVVLLTLIVCGLFAGFPMLYAQPEKSGESPVRPAGELSNPQGGLSKEEGDKLKAEIETVRKDNEQLELKSKELVLQLEKQKEQIRDKERLSRAVKSVQAELQVLKQQKQELSGKINELHKDARTKEAGLYEEQAAAFMKAKLPESAITAYEHSLKLNPANAHVHYTVGLLYSQVYQDRKEAVAHLKEYIKLSPLAKDKKEARYMVDMLSSGMD